MLSFTPKPIFVAELTEREKTENSVKFLSEHEKDLTAGNNVCIKRA